MCFSFCLRLCWRDAYTYKLVTDRGMGGFYCLSMMMRVCECQMYTGAVSEGRNVVPSIRVPEILKITTSRMVRLPLQSIGEIPSLSFKALHLAGPARDERDETGAARYKVLLAQFLDLIFRSILGLPFRSIIPNITLFTFLSSFILHQIIVLYLAVLGPPYIYVLPSLSNSCVIFFCNSTF